MPTFIDKVTSKNSWGTPANSLSFDLGVSYPSGTFFLLWVASWDAGAGINLFSVAGWNTIQVMSGGAGLGGTLMYRIADVDEPAIQSISGSNPTEFCDVISGTLMVFSGVNTTNPIHTYLMEAGDGSDISPSGIPNEGSYPLPEITTVIDGCTLVTGTCHKNPNQDKINIGVIPSGYLYVDSVKDVTAPNAPFADTIIFRSNGDQNSGTYSASVTIEDTDLDSSGEFPEWVTFTVALAGDGITTGPCLSERIEEYWNYNTDTLADVFGYGSGPTLGYGVGYNLPAAPVGGKQLQVTFHKNDCDAYAVLDTHFSQDLDLPVDGFGFAVRLGPYNQVYYECGDYATQIEDIIADTWIVLEVANTFRILAEVDPEGTPPGVPPGTSYRFQVYDPVGMQWVEAAVRTDAEFAALWGGNSVSSNIFWMYCFLHADGTLETWFRRYGSNFANTPAYFEPEIKIEAIAEPPTTFGTTVSTKLMEYTGPLEPGGLFDVHGWSRYAIDELVLLHSPLTFDELMDLNEGLPYPQLTDWETTCQLVQNFFAGDMDISPEMYSIDPGLLFSVGVLSMLMEMDTLDWQQELTFLAGDMDVTIEEGGLLLPELEALISEMEVELQMAGVIVVYPIREILLSYSANASIRGNVKS